MRVTVSPLQWQARLDCAAVIRHCGQTDLAFNPITLHVPDRRDPCWRD